MFVNNGLLVNAPPPLPVSFRYMYTLVRPSGYLVLLSVEVGQPCLKICHHRFLRSLCSYIIHDLDIYDFFVTCEPTSPYDFMVCVGTALRGLDVFVIVLEHKEMFETCHGVSVVSLYFLALHDDDELYTCNECELVAVAGCGPDETGSVTVSGKSISPC